MLIINNFVDSVGAFEFIFCIFQFCRVLTQVPIYRKRSDFLGNFYFANCFHCFIIQRFMRSYRQTSRPGSENFSSTEIVLDLVPFLVLKLFLISSLHHGVKVELCSPIFQFLLRERQLRSYKFTFFFFFTRFFSNLHI